MKEEWLIMESDGDSPVVSSLYVSRNHYGELVICLETDNYSDDATADPDDKVVAVLDKESITVLSKCLGIRPENMGKHLYDAFHEGGYIGRTSYVRSRFKDILEYILDHGGKYRLT